MGARALMAAATVAAALTATARERAADACSCPPPDEHRVLPENGATGVALDTAILVVEAPASDAVVSLRPSAGGGMVALVSDSWQRALAEQWVWARPEALLAPATSYEILVDGAVVSTFTTGDQEDAEAPAFAGLTSFSPHVFTNDMCSSGVCWDRQGKLDRVEVAVSAVPADVALLVLELSTPEGAPLYEAPLVARDGAATLLSSTCEESVMAPDLTPGAQVCATVLAYDQSGNVAGAEQRACETVTSCAVDTCLTPHACAAGEPDAGLGPDTGGCSAGGAAGAVPAVFALLLLGWRRRRATA